MPLSSLKEQRWRLICPACPRLGQAVDEDQLMFYIRASTGLQSFWRYCLETRKDGPGMGGWQEESPQKDALFEEDP